MSTNFDGFFMGGICDYILQVITKGGGSRLGWGQNHRGSGGRESPSGVQGRRRISVLEGIIPLSLRNGGFDTVCPLVCKWGATAPGSATYGDYRFWW